MTVGQGNDTTYECSVTLMILVLPWFKVITHPWVMDNNCLIIQIQIHSIKLGHRQGLRLCVECDRDLGDKTLVQGHYTSLGHGQQSCGKCYGPDKDYGYECSVTLTLEK